MKKLVLIIVVLALCAPSFGAILVYKQKASSLKGFEFGWDAISQDVTIQIPDPCDANQTEVDTKTLTSAQEASSKFEGYVVMDVNIDTLLINDKHPVDNNSLTASNVAAAADGAAMVIVDKKNKQYQVIYLTGRLEPNDLNNFENKADANYGIVNEDGIYPAGVVNNKKGTATKKTLAYLELTGHLASGVDVNIADYNDPNHKKVLAGSLSMVYETQKFELCTMTGALKNTDIDGTKEKVSVPTSLKGYGNKYLRKGANSRRFIQYGRPDPCDPADPCQTTYVIEDRDIYTETDLGGKATLTLDKKLTQAANNLDNPTTLGAVQALIEEVLEPKNDAADLLTEVPPQVPYIYD